MAKKAVQGTVIILDIGKNVITNVDGGKSFFHSARDCVARIIERKILSGGKDLVGILLLGCRTLKKENPDEISFKNIEWMVEPQEPTWEMIRNLPKEPTKHKGDFMDSILIATQYFKKKMYGIKLNAMKIIILTNFEEPTTMEPKEIKRILEGFKNESFEIDIIGPDINQTDRNDIDFEFARELVRITDGTTATFDYTMRYLLFHKKKAPNPTPCNMDLCIGPNLKIPISTYIRIKDETVVGKWVKSVKDPVTLKASTTEGIKRDKNDNTEKQSGTESTGISKAYHFGGELIPLVENDKLMLYKSGEKGLFVYGFTDINKIQWQSLNGDGMHYIFGRKGDKNSQHAIRCLVECLDKMKLAGVVRKVHYNNTAPKMFALMPVIDNDNYICLSLLPLCFKEEIKHMMFPPINMKKYSCTDEQLIAFKDLIKAMNLAEAYDETFDDTEAFPIAEAVSPAAQYVLDCIAFRALNPGCPLPQPRDEIMALFKVPPLLEKRSRQPLEKIKQLFPLKEVEEKTKKRKLIPKDEQSIIDNEQASTSDITQPNDNGFIPRISLPKTNTKKVQKIGTVDPVTNYTELINAGNTLSDLAADMTAAIESLIYFSLDESYTKALNAWAHFRRECVKDNPIHYNSWLQTFKTELNSRKKDDVLVIITEKNLGYILKSENDLSTFDNEFSHDESQMYENDTVPDATDIKINKEVNDMFDEM